MLLNDLAEAENRLRLFSYSYTFMPSHRRHAFRSALKAEGGEMTLRLTAPLGWPITAPTLAFLLSVASTSNAEAQDGDKSRYTLTDPTPPELMREISTDRPDKTESAYTVDAGHFQFELDFATFTTDRNDDVALRTETLNVSPINLKVGLNNSTDLQLVVESYLRQTATNRVTGTKDETDGFGDVTVRLKHNLWGNDGGQTALALMPFVKLPTNTKGLGNDAVEFGLLETPEGLRIYGAGILSSGAESVFSLDDPSPNRLGFDSARVMRTPYRIDDLQQVYFVVTDLDVLIAGVDLRPVPQGAGPEPEALPIDAVLETDVVLSMGSQR